MGIDVLFALILGLALIAVMTLVVLVTAASKNVGPHTRT